MNRVNSRNDIGNDDSTIIIVMAIIIIIIIIIISSLFLTISLPLPPHRPSRYCSLASQFFLSAKSIV